VQLPSGEYQVPARWQAGLSNGANVGEVIGLFINGYVSERFGYRYTVMTCLMLIIGFTAIFFTAQSVIDLQVAEILCGIVSTFLLSSGAVLNGCSRGVFSKLSQLLTPLKSVPLLFVGT
jgi:MFS family permease